MKSPFYFPINLQFFAEGDGVTGAGGAERVNDTAAGADNAGAQPLDVAGLTALLNSMNQQHSGDNNANQQEPDQTEVPPSDNQNQNQEPNGQQNTQSNQNQKDANAFAAMRVQNKQMSEMLEKIAKATGIQYANQDEMMQKLNDDALAKMAAQQNVPVELLQRLDILEKHSQAYLAMQNQTRLTNEFAALRDKYKLDDVALTEFAKQLEADKVDPTTVNIEREYMMRNFDAILAQRTQAAVEAALKKDAQAGAHGTMPNVAQGSSANGGASQHKVTTTAELNALLATMPK